MTDNYIVSPFRKPHTPVLTGCAGASLCCPVCGNADQNKFWTVTGLAATSLRGAVCGPCEERKVSDSNGDRA